jgi:restriction endonuclease S subunit
MNTTLGEIASVRIGIYKTTHAEGDGHYLQVGHFNPDGARNPARLLFKDILIDDVAEKHLLQAGDVLFAAKGSNNVAVTVTEDLLPAVASTIFLVIKIADDCKSVILPEYLSWFLNTYASQNWIKNQAMGSSISSISKEKICEMPIVIPEVEKQKRILGFQKLVNKEKELVRKLTGLKDKLYNEILLKSIK